MCLNSNKHRLRNLKYNYMSDWAVNNHSFLFLCHKFGHKLLTMLEPGQGMPGEVYVSPGSLMKGCLFKVDQCFRLYLEG
jgi:hypothetical protein